MPMKPSPCDVTRFSTEFQLACACCRVTPTSRDLATIERLLPQIDVPAFIDLVVVRHRIGPLVWAKLKQLPAAMLPPSLAKPLAREARSNAFKALRAVRAHSLINRWFNEAGIVWLPFKGVTLAQRWYGDVSLRHVNDQDLWVPPDSLKAARTVLIGQGFQWDPLDSFCDVAARGPRHRDFLVRYLMEEQYVSAEHGQIDLHWHLTENRCDFDLLPQDILGRGDRLTMGAESIRVMNSVDLLLYLCEHGGRHCWYRLKWLADLPQLLERATWNWTEVFERAERVGCTGTLLLGLTLTRDLFGWAAPPAVARQLSGLRCSGVLCRIVRTGLLAPKQWWSDVGRISERWLWRLHLARLLMSNWRGSAVVLWRLSLAPNDLRAASFPDHLFFLYRLARPFSFGMRRWARFTDGEHRAKVVELPRTK